MLTEFAPCTVPPPVLALYENVPGLLSVKDNAFGCFLAGLAGEDIALEPPGRKWTDAGAVFGPARAVAWRLLDAQYFGLAQRRRRVFVVASAREGFDPAAVLFEFQGLRRDTAPSREAGEEVTPTLRAGAPNGGAGHGARSGDSKDELIVAHTLRGEGFDASEDGTGRGTPLVPVTVGALTAACGPNGHGGSGLATDKGAEAGAHPPAIAFNWNAQADQMNFSEHSTPTLTTSQQAAVCFGGNRTSGPLEVAPSLTAHSSPMGRLDFETETFVAGTQVRRLMPVECERLQGFPDEYTAVPWRRGKLDAFITGEECPDGPRYKALGNSWPVPVVTWIGRRIQEALK